MNIEIKRHPRYSHYGSDIDGNIYSFKHGKIKELSKCPHSRGYQQFGIRQYGEGHMYLVHRFVYECWSEKLIQDGMQCHHIDHDKTNNAFSNLEIVDQLMNMQYGKEAGVLYGAASPNHPFYWR
jgi:hypothetical protein